MPDIISSLQPGDPLHVQVERQVRAAIASGEWSPGMKLPANDALAESFGTSVFTVQTALSRLCREGLLERTPRLGTFVRGKGTRLTCAGVYFGSNVWTDLESAFSKLVYRHIADSLSASGINSRVWTDTRPEPEQGKPLPELMQAIKRREIQGLFVPLANGTDIRWLKKLPISTAIMFGDADIQGRLALQIDQALRQAMASARAQGCRTIGLITSIKVRNELLEESGDTSPTFFSNFIDAVRDSGLETKNEWILAAQDYPRFLETYGYEQFNALWSRKDRPDAIFVYPDVVARGVITAALAKRVRVPSDLKLILHANDEIPYPCPFPAAQIVTPVSECADGLRLILRRKLEDSPVSSIVVQSAFKASS